MHTLPVTLRSRSPGVPPFVTQGVAPSAVSPLCVTPLALWDAKAKRWLPQSDPDDPGFIITHRPTGYALGSGLNDKAIVRGKWEAVAEGQGAVFDTEAEALAVMARCEPDFPAWPMAGDNEAARAACKTKFKWAMETGERP